MLKRLDVEKVSILGCGWYGLPLGKKLVNLGYNVKGSTTNSAKLALLKASGISPYLLKITDSEVASFPLGFLESELLIVNIPPERREDIENYYFQQMNILLGHIKKSNIKEIILISSTSVYPDTGFSTNENEKVYPDKQSGKVLLKVENLFQNYEDAKLMVLRFAGLFGADRNPGRFLAEKRSLKDGNAPVNLVHLDDCIEITIKLLQKKCYGEIFNVCADHHPLRKDFYQKAAVNLGLTPPEFLPSEEAKKYKIVSNAKVKKALDQYQFLFADPLDAI